ncbi:hypothetical protein I4U23_015173 [Adineta vaga]|nr:hypothetical protein I4U23_015173 [Adineta vaga]
MWWNIIRLLIISQCIFCEKLYDKDNDSAHGIRFPGNDQFLIFANNLFAILRITFQPFGKLSHDCSVVYPIQDSFVYSLIALSTTHTSTATNKLHKFVQVAENMNNQSVLLSVLVINEANCEIHALNNFSVVHDRHQDYMLLKMDSEQKFVYLFIPIVDFKIYAGMIFYMRAVDITDAYAILVGFSAYLRNTDLITYVVLLFTLNPIQVISWVNINDYQPVWTSRTLIYTVDSTMSIAINPTQHQPESFSMEVECCWRSPYLAADFGVYHSAVWLSERTIATSFIKVPNRPWSLSEIRVVTPCIAGTYKNTTDIGPCKVCPPQTKNLADRPCNQCEPCASTSFCSLGAIGDVSIKDYPSYTQTFHVLIHLI